MTDAALTSLEGTVQTIRKTAYEQIRTLLLDAGLTGHDFVMLDFTANRGLEYLMSHRLIPDYEPTKWVEKEIFEKLAPYEVMWSEGCSRSISCAVDKQGGKRARIWPHVAKDGPLYESTSVDSLLRTQHLSLEVRYQLPDYPTPVRLPNGHKAHIWKVVTLAGGMKDTEDVWPVLAFKPEDFAQVYEFIRNLCRLIVAVKVRQREITVFGGSDINLGDQRYRWEDVVLPPDVEAAVRHDLEFWIANEDLYEAKRIPYRRGYLFEGPPGNGKTVTARVIMSSYDFACYMLNFNNPHLDDSEMQDAFTIAGRNAPSVILLEDLDRVFAPGERNTMISREGLLNCLDGIAVHRGLVVIATANNPKYLDPAVRLRPGRFDVPVRFDHPGTDQRRRYFMKMLGTDKDNQVTSRTLEEVIRRTKGKSMAFLKLIYETSCARAFRTENDLLVSDAHMLDALNTCLVYYERVETGSERRAGFGRDIEPANEKCQTTRAPRGVVREGKRPRTKEDNEREELRPAEQTSAPSEHD